MKTLRLICLLSASVAMLLIGCGNDFESSKSNENPSVETPDNPDNPDNPENPQPDDPENPQPDEPENPDTPAQITIPEGYSQLLWSDEFNGDELNLEDWNIEVNGDGGGNNELQYYSERGVSIGEMKGEKCLVLTARKESSHGKTCTSGRVNTMGKITFLHGRIDGRIMVPNTANGLWPAFWLMGDNYKQVGWPKCGEIDILEMGNSEGIKNGTQDRYFNGACHWGEDWRDHMQYAYGVTYDYSLQDGEFHLFTCIRDSEKVAMYVDLDKYPDAEPYYIMNVNNPDSDRHPANYLHVPCFVLLNVAVGGNFTGIWDINQITALSSGEASMYIDYVRIFIE